MGHFSPTFFLPIFGKAVSVEKSWVLKNHLVSIHEKKWWFGVTRLDATEPVSEFHPKTDTERCGGRWCVALDFMWTNQKQIAIQVLESHYFERKQFASQEKKGSPTNFLQSWFEHHPTEIDLWTPGKALHVDLEKRRFGKKGSHFGRGGYNVDLLQEKKARYYNHLGCIPKSGGK